MDWSNLSWTWGGFTIGLGNPMDIFTLGAWPFTFVGYVLLVIGLWPTLEKAGVPGWGALIPVYNTYLIVKLGQRSGWVMLLLAVPLVNIFVVFMIVSDVSRAFGKDFLFGFLALFLFFPLGFLQLGYGSSVYLPGRLNAPYWVR